jgi:penicillin-binding protein 1A
MGVKLPQPVVPQSVAAYRAQPKAPEIKPGPPPVLTKRGADVLVQVEKLLDDAAKTADKTSASEPPRPGKPVSSSALPFPDSFAAETSDNASLPRKN